MNAKKAIKEFIFEDGKHFDSCHASTILPLDGGDVLCAYFAGSREGADDVGIWLSRKTGGKWREPVLIAKDEELPHWNPVLFSCKDGVRLVYKVGENVPVWKSRTRISKDFGETWSEPFAYPAPHDACGPVRSKPLLRGDGSLIAPNSVETKENWRPFADISLDGGRSFQKCGGIPINTFTVSAPEFMGGKGAIQPALWEDKNHELHALLRTTAGYVYASESLDGGVTWSLARRTSIPNNNSGIETAVHGRDVFLILNPVSNLPGQHKGERYPLSIMKSSDNGESFEPFFELEAVPSDDEIARSKELYASRAYGGAIQYSYPAAVVKGGILHVSYTYSRRMIAVWEISLD